VAINIPIISSLDAKGFDKATREFKSLATNSERSGFLIKKAALPAAAALAGIGAAAFSATKAAIEDQAAQTRLAGALARTTGASNATIKATEQYIDKLSEQSAVADDELRPALTTLVTGTKNLQKAQELLAVSLDISAQTGASLEATSAAMSKGFAGNTRALASLSPELKTMIKNGASFDDVLVQLKSNFKGASQEAANTAEGGVKKLKNALNETKEGIGKALIPAVEALTPLLVAMGLWAKNNAPIITGVAVAVGVFATAIVAARIAMAAWKAMSIITTGVNWALSTSFTAVQVATGVGIATAIAGAAAFVYIKNKMNDARGAAIGYGSAIGNLITSQQELNKYIGPVATRDFEVMKKMSQGMTLAQAEAAVATERTAVASEKLKTKQEKAAAAAKKLKDELKAAKDILGDQFVAAITKANGVLDEAVGKFNDYKNGISDAVTGNFSFANAQKETEESGKTFLESLREQATKVKNFGVLLNRLIAAGLNETALSQVLAAGTEAGTLIAEELLNTAGGVLEANTLTNDVKSIADQVGANSAAKFYQAGVDAGTNLVRGIQAVVDSYTIRLNAATTIQQVQNLTAGFGADSGAVFAGGGAPAPNLGGLGGFDLSQILAGFSVGGLATLADGGIVTGPTLAMVGEGGGPEAVIPLSQAGRFGLDGGGTTVNINVNGGDPNAVVQALRTYMRQNGSVPIRVSTP
jgi:hypothetical protein